MRYSFKVNQKDSEIYVPYEFDDRFELSKLTGEFKLNVDHILPSEKYLNGKYEIEIEVKSNKLCRLTKLFK